MDTLTTTLYHLLLLLFFLVLPRLLATPSSGLDNKVEIEDLVLERVGYIPAEGLYACFRREGGAAPDLSLLYSATYTHGAANTPTTCNGEISLRASEAGGSMTYCLPPCSGVETTHLHPITLVVTGHDRTTSETTAALLESFTLSNTTPAVIQAGRGVVEVQWAARPGRAYRVQLWHHPHNSEATRAGTQEESGAGVVKVEAGVEQSKGGHGEGSEAGEVDASDLTKTEIINDGGGENEEHDASVIAKEFMDEAMINEKLPREKELLEENAGGSLKGAETLIKKNTSGMMEPASLMKVRQCYRDLDTDIDEEDDDDYDDDNDDDHEDDNDDFLKWKRWRSCVALHSPDAPVTPAATVLMHTSGTVSCSADTCFYYVTDSPASGSVSVEVIDVTDAVLHSFHAAPIPVQEWGNLTISTVVVASEGTGADPRPKAMTVNWSDGSQVQEGSSMGTVEAEGEAEGEAVEDRSTEGDLHAVIINGHGHSEVLRSLPGECDDLGGMCTVRSLETLVDPEGRGPVSKLLLLLSNHQTAASVLLPVADVHVRVMKLAPDTLTVLWDRDPHVQEFAVRVVAESGTSSDTVIVACSKRGSDCLATFKSLGAGQYRAEVSYEREATVVLSVPFSVDDDAVECRAPYSEVGGRCVLAVTEITGTWHEMHSYCNLIGGHLLTLDTDNLHYQIVKYLQDTGLTGHSYWIGANNERLDGEYQWRDGTPVKMGTPFWGTVQDVQEPNGENEHCAGLHGLHYFFIHGFSCELSLPAICESTGAPL